MRASIADDPAPYAALYSATLDHAARAGESILRKTLAVVRQSLKDRASQVRGLVERDNVELSIRLLDSHAKTLCERFPDALRVAFSQAMPPTGGPAGTSLNSLHFDQLELMDSDQVNQSVVLARSQQAAMLAADAALAELNTYVCATLGMKSVHPERNPLRPEVFVQALHRLLEETQVPTVVRLDWLQHMSTALGSELGSLYTTLSRQLQDQGVMAAGYVVVRTHDSGGRAATIDSHHALQSTTPERRGRRVSDPSGMPDASVLTLGRLRSLLAGELDQQASTPDVQAFAAHFAREFESRKDAPPVADFAATVPAAFEALQEMKQVDRMMERIGSRRRVADGGSILPDAPQEVRDQLRREVTGLGSTLSLEVVALMVENIAQDARLLEPIRDVVKNLEPALLRLALVDPRFFSDKQHPARRLLDEIAHRSLAFHSVTAPGFNDFLSRLKRVVGPLSGMQIESADPFEKVLKELIQLWDEHTQPGQLESAVKALQHAEDRNLRAGKVAREIQASPHVKHLAQGVVDFLCGPWAQVIAHAQMGSNTAATDPGQYRELVLALAWSAQPELTRKDIPKLTRLVPKLLAKLREGLDLIGYPSVKTSEFFELLMNLHQQAFKVSTKAVAPPLAPQGLLVSLLDEGPWIAPAEAKASGFMDLPLEPASRAPASSAGERNAQHGTPVLSMNQAVGSSIDQLLPVGAWVEMLVNGAWTRTQLSWASPHGTLFLFTSTYGSTQSMTRRSRDKLLAAGHMRVVSSQPVVDGALDAVVKTAMLNSIDIKL